jgi:hypothetical protein
MGAKKDSFEVVSVDQGTYFNSMVVVQKTTHHRWEIVNVYGPAQHEFSQDFLWELSEKLLRCPEPVIVGGGGF